MPGAIQRGNVEGHASFYEATYSGSAIVSAAEAGLVVSGPVEAIIRGNVSIAVHEYTDVGVKARAGYDLSYAYSSEGRTFRMTYTDATLRIVGGPDGLIQAWPTIGDGRSSFDLSVGPAADGLILAAPVSRELFSEDGRHTYTLPSPLFVLAHDQPGTDPSLVGSAVFRDLRARGAVELTVARSIITVEGGGSGEVHALGERHAAEGVPVVQYREVKDAFITVHDADVLVRFEGTQGWFFARDPAWSIDGTLALHAEDGRISADGEDRSLREAEVEIDGNVSFALRATGQDDGRTALGIGLPPPLLPQPKIHGVLDADASETRVNGERLQTIPPPIREEAPLVARIVGACVLVWGAIRRVLVLLLGAFGKDPLAHPRRRQIQTFLTEVGVAHLRDIHRATRMPLGSLVHHLHVLRRTGLVQSVRRGVYRVHFVPSSRWSLEEMTHLALLAEPTRRRLGKALAEGGPASQEALADRVGISRSAVSQHMRKLEEAGLVEKIGTRDIQYVPTHILRRWVHDAEDNRRRAAH